MSRERGASELKERLQDVAGDEFEQLVADLWESRGWETEVEQQSRDGGVDVRAVKDTPYSQKQLIQAKRYSDATKVGRPDVQQYASLKQQEAGVDAAVIVTTSSFTNPAETLAETLNVKAVDGDDLVRMIHDEGAFDIVNEYIETSRESAASGSGGNVSSPSNKSYRESSTPEPTSADTFSVIDTPLFDIEYEEGFSPESADPSKTWRYYAVWAGSLLGFAYFLSIPLGDVALTLTLALVVGFGTPVATALDARSVGAISWHDPMWWASILATLIPCIGPGVYLLHRRAVRIDVEERSGRTD